jgi:hypothetical protein
MAAAPDLTALAQEILNRQAGAAEAAGTAQVSTIGRFTVVDGGPATPLQALTWDAAGRRLLHWTVPPTARAAVAAVWSDLLASFRTASGETAREWALFGIRVRLPAQFTPREVTARPGAVSIEFTRPDGMSVTARRLSLATVLLAERTLLQWLRHSLLAERAALGANRVQGAVVTSDFTIRGERPYDRMVWRKWQGEARWWHQPERNRILGVEQVGPRHATRLELSHVWLD